MYLSIILIIYINYIINIIMSVMLGQPHGLQLKFIIKKAHKKVSPESLKNGIKLSFKV